MKSLAVATARRPLVNSFGVALSERNAAPRLSEAATAQQRERLDPPSHRFGGQAEAKRPQRERERDHDHEHEHEHEHEQDHEHEHEQDHEHEPFRKAQGP